MDEDMVSDALASLREIPGVQGAFVVDSFGRLVASSVSSLFPDYALQSAAQKVALLCESVYENFDSSEELMLAFEGYAITLRRGVFGILVVLAERSANAEGLRMGTSVVSRRLVMLHGQPPSPPTASRTLREAGDPSRRTGAHGKIATGSNVQGRVATSAQGRVATSAQGRVATSGQGKPQRNATGGNPAPSSGAVAKKSPDSRAGAEPTKKKKSDIWG
jgi:predicted regulator of Ras-like GTPase activity (Roadblock/LC7/MglB family)